LPLGSSSKSLDVQLTERGRERIGTFPILRLVCTIADNRYNNPSVDEVAARIAFAVWPLVAAEARDQALDSHNSFPLLLGSLRV
jgi:hypothetical protein